MINTTLISAMGDLRLGWNLEIIANICGSGTGNSIASYI